MALLAARSRATRRLPGQAEAVPLEKLVAYASDQVSARPAAQVCALRCLRCQAKTKQAGSRGRLAPAGKRAP